MSELKQKCYNSFSCILSVLIIIFVVGSIMWDICISKPALRGQIQEIHTEIKDIHQKLNASFLQDTVSYQPIMFDSVAVDSVEIEEM